MKKIICLAVGLLTLTLTPVFGQPSTPSPAVLNYGSGQAVSYIQPPNKPELTKFNLDFPGGTPAELVKAIEKAMGKPLNAIIPTENADLQIPPLKMSDVTVLQLFAALQAASRKTVAVQSQNGAPFGNSYSTFTTGYGFTTADSPITDTTIWYFHVEKPSMPPVVSTEKICRFYSLDPYLNRGFTVDDITTAIQTGWKMAGVTSPPELDYHKETKLLIAFGEPEELETIQNVLQALPATKVYLGDVEDLRANVFRLQKQVEDLTKKVSAQNLPPNPSPEEKSGK